MRKSWTEDNEVNKEVRFSPPFISLFVSFVLYRESTSAGDGAWPRKRYDSRQNIEQKIA